MFNGFLPALMVQLLAGPTVHRLHRTDSHKMQNPFQPSRSIDRQLGIASVSIRSVLLASVATFVIALFCAALAGIFIVIFGPSLSNAEGDATLLFDAIFFPAFVWLPFLLCGYIAGRIAGRNHVAHGLYAGCVYLVVNIAMSIPWRFDNPYFWTHVLSCVLIVPLALLGGKLAERLREIRPGTTTSTGLSFQRTSPLRRRPLR
ncbi:hypothetical protein Poly51_47760 [Rubripirellula tenax]|uniref:Uncharacterized protein n=1 Tax=Rubripirellula tenax TaxID=2528015 RepID=A0A5C6EII8_9BACT|nr:hypothetical protein Poly51_47760 [Rubripirellula tenax]